MGYYLMKKNIPVFSFEYSDVSGNIKVKSVDNIEMAPYSIYSSYILSRDSLRPSLEDWIDFRSVSGDRLKSSRLFQRSELGSKKALMFKTMGLSLTDPYWFKDEGSEGTWEQVNFFDNAYGQSLLFARKEGPAFWAGHPDYSTNGELEKFWRKLPDGDYLFKANSPDMYSQENYNEVFADKLLNVLDMPHVHYSLVQEDDRIYARCKNFASENIEYVPALELLYALKRNPKDSNYVHFLKCLEQARVPYSEKFLQNMLLFDYVINNSDRHYGNFGFLRDTETGRFTGHAPLFDHGSSLWHKTLTEYISLIKQPAKPFRNTHEKQIQLLDKADLPLEKLTSSVLDAAAKQSFLSLACRPFSAERRNKIVEMAGRLRDRYLMRQR